MAVKIESWVNSMAEMSLGELWDLFDLTRKGSWKFVLLFLGETKVEVHPGDWVIVFYTGETNDHTDVQAAFLQEWNRLHE